MRGLRLRTKKKKVEDLRCRVGGSLRAAKKSSSVDASLSAVFLV